MKTMKTIKIIERPAFISPYYLRQFNYQTVDSVIDEDGKVVIGDKHLHLEDNDLSHGDEVVVYTKSMEVVKKSDHDEYLKIEAEKRILDGIAYKKKLIDSQEKLKLKRVEFHDLYDVPFEYHTSPKEVLSGLSANSSGNGLMKNSKWHVVVDEKINIGQLSRNKGEFLCSQSKSKWGANWSGQKECYKEKMVITCATCLKRMAKFLKKSK